MPELTLSRTSFPFLTRPGWRAPLQWTHGPLYNVLLSSSVLRVGERGVSWCATCDLPTAGFGAAGQRMPCLPAPDALCAAPFPALNTSLLLFPSGHVRVPAERVLAQRVSASAALGLWAAVQDSCHAAESNRALVFGDRQHDVSLCDLVHGKLDFVWYPQEGELAWRQRGGAEFFDGLLWTALVTLAVLFLFTRVCENLSNIIRGRRRASDWHATVVVILGTACSFPATARNDFATEERVLTLVLQVYAFFYVFIILCDSVFAKQWAFARLQLWAYARLPDAENPTPAPAEPALAAPAPADSSVNTTGALIAVLLLLTAHLQNTYATPFLSIFVLIFGARSFLKFLNLTLKHSRRPDIFALLKLAVLLVDTFAFAAVLELAVRTGARSKSEYASTAAGLLLLSALGGVFLFQVVESRPPSAPE